MAVLLSLPDLLQTSNMATTNSSRQYLRAMKIKANVQLSLLLIMFVCIIFSCNRQKPEARLLQAGIPAMAATNAKLIEEQLIKSKATKKKIYLTFDDGPNKGTGNVLRTVKEEKIPASFFVVGKHVFDSPAQGETFRELKADSSVELCNHSYTHALNHYTKFYQHPSAVIKDFQRSEAALSLNSKVARMPGRNAWRIDSIDHTDIKTSKAAIDSVYNAGFAVMGWDVEWMFDHKTLDLVTDTDQLLRQIQNMLEASATKTPGHLVLLAHDQAFQKKADVEKLHFLIHELKKNPAYELELASNYPGVKKEKPVTSVMNPVPVLKK